MDEDDDMKSVFGLPDNEKSHATRSASRKKNGRGKKKSRRKDNKKKPRKKRPQKKRSGCSKERLFLNFRELGWDVSYFYWFQAYFWPDENFLKTSFSFLIQFFKILIFFSEIYYCASGLCSVPVQGSLRFSTQSSCQRHKSCDCPSSRLSNCKF